MASSCPVPVSAEQLADLQRPAAAHIDGARNRASTPVPREQKNKVQVGSALLQSEQDSATAEHVAIPSLSEGVLRAGFLSKVYGILAAQMILTVVVAVACSRVPAIQTAFISLFHSHSRMVQFAIFTPTLLSLLSLKEFGAKQHYPTNYVLLFVFTMSQAINVGYVCVVYEAAGHGDLILMAFAITAFLFVALTLYTLYGGRDMSFMRGFLFTSLSGLVVAGLVAVFVPRLRDSVAVAVIGAVTFCGYIVYDTWRIEQVFGYDDYILAAIELYLDIINLFFYILKILLKSEKKGKKN